MYRLAGFAVLLASVTSAAVGQNSVPLPNASAAPSELSSHSPPKVLAQGLKNLNDLIDILDRRADNVAVTVDGQAVTDGEVADELRGYPASVGYMPIQSAYKLALESVMRQRALAIKAVQAGTGNDPAVQRRIMEATNRVLVAEYLRREITPRVTDQVLRERYDSQIAGKPGPLEAHIRVIMLSSWDEALDARNQLRTNKDFGELAKEISKDASAASSGDLGWVPLDSVDPAIGSVAFALNPGDISTNPVRAAGGWFIVRNDGVRQQAAPTFEASKERLRREIVAEEVRAIRGNMAAKISAEPGKIPSVTLSPPTVK